MSSLLGLLTVLFYTSAFSQLTTVTHELSEFLERDYTTHFDAFLNALSPGANVLFSFRNENVQKLGSADQPEASYCVPNGTLLVLLQDSGILADKKDPNQPYDSYMNCRWLISPKSSVTTQPFVIRLKFTSFDLEQGTTGECVNCTCDYIELYDGNVSLPTTSVSNILLPSHLVGERLCGTHSPNSLTLLSSGEEMYVTFSSDAWTAGNGFRAYYEVLYLAQGMIRFTQDIFFIPPFSKDAIIEIECSNCSGNIISVNLFVQEDSAKEGVDYLFLSPFQVIWDDPPRYRLAIPLLDIGIENSRISRQFSVKINNLSSSTINTQMVVTKSVYLNNTNSSSDIQPLLVPKNELSCVVVLVPLTAFIGFREIAINASYDSPEVLIIVECRNCTGLNLTAYVSTHDTGSAVPYLDYVPLNTTISFNSSTDISNLTNLTLDIKNLTLRIPLIGKETRTETEIQKNFKVFLTDRTNMSDPNTTFPLPQNTTVIFDSVLNETIVIILPPPCGLGQAYNATRISYSCGNSTVSETSYYSRTEINGSTNATNYTLLCQQVVTYFNVSDDDLYIPGEWYNGSEFNGTSQYDYVIKKVCNASSQEFLEPNSSLAYECSLFETCAQRLLCQRTVDVVSICACPADRTGKTCHDTVPLQCTLTIYPPVDWVVSGTSVSGYGYDTELDGDPPLYTPPNYNSLGIFNILSDCSMINPPYEGFDSNTSNFLLMNGYTIPIISNYNFTYMVQKSQLWISVYKTPLTLLLKVWNLIFLSDQSQWKTVNVSVQALNFTDVTSPTATTPLSLNIANLSENSFQRGGRVYLELMINSKGDLKGLISDSTQVSRIFIEVPQWKPISASPRVVAPWIWVLVVFGLLGFCALVVFFIRYRHQQKEELAEVQRELLLEEKHGQGALSPPPY